MRSISTKLGYAFAVFLTTFHTLVMFISFVSAVYRADYELIALSACLLTMPFFVFAILKDKGVRHV